MFFCAVCATYSNLVKDGQPPHIVFDATKTPVLSEIVKSFTLALALPTVSASFGLDNDFQQWHNLSAEKQRYLLQIIPPTDIIPEIIQLIVVHMNMTNAAVLFDSKTFGKFKKLKNLLLFVNLKEVFIKFRSNSFFLFIIL